MNLAFVPGLRLWPGIFRMVERRVGFAPTSPYWKQGALSKTSYPRILEGCDFHAISGVSIRRADHRCTYGILHQPSTAKIVILFQFATLHTSFSVLSSANE